MLQHLGSHFDSRLFQSISQNSACRFHPRGLLNLLAPWNWQWQTLCLKGRARLKEWKMKIIAMASNLLTALSLQSLTLARCLLEDVHWYTSATCAWNTTPTACSLRLPYVQECFLEYAHLQKKRFGMPGLGENPIYLCSLRNKLRRSAQMVKWARDNTAPERQDTWYAAIASDALSHIQSWYNTGSAHVMCMHPVYYLILYI